MLVSIISFFAILFYVITVVRLVLRLLQSTDLNFYHVHEFQTAIPEYP